MVKNIDMKKRKQGVNNKGFTVNQKQWVILNTK